MTAKILVAVDESAPAMRAVEHLARIARDFRSAEVTLFHVTGVPPEHAEHPGSESPTSERHLEEQVAERAASFREQATERAMPTVFGPAKKRLEGIPGVNVRVKLATSPDDRVAPALLDELTTHHYDVVVVGRSDHSKVRELVMGSVTQRVLDEVKECAVWVVG